MTSIPLKDFQVFFEASPGFCLILSPQLKIIAASNDYLHAAGLKKEDITGKDLFEIILHGNNAEDFSGLRASLNNVLKDKTTQTITIHRYDILSPGGKPEKKYWTTLNKPVLDDKGEVTYIIQRIEEVMGGDERFRHALDNMLEGIQILGFDWRYLYVNDSVARHGRYAKEELLGFTIMEKYPGIEQAEIYKIMERCMNERVAFHLENEFAYPDNSKGWFDLSIQPVPEGILVLSLDITGRKKAEEEVKKLNTGLEAQVEKRTAQFEAANKELEAFSYSVSHDLRAPLRAINGYSNILLEEYAATLDNDGRHMLGLIQNNVKKMGNLIDDLLAFSRLGKKEVQKVNVDMHELAESAWHEYNSLNKNNAKVKIEKLKPAPADHVLMAQVWANLVSNAVKYSSKKDKPEIEIKSQVKGDDIIYSVSDNGVGFDMQYAHKLFGVFQRLHPMDEFEGTGVGLAIVKRIVDKHGGKVWAEGKPGQGATIFFALPADKK